MLLYFYCFGYKVEHKFLLEELLTENVCIKYKFDFLY